MTWMSKEKNSRNSRSREIVTGAFAVSLSRPSYGQVCVCPFFCQKYDHTVFRFETCCPFPPVPQRLRRRRAEAPKIQWLKECRHFSCPEELQGPVPIRGLLLGVRSLGGPVSSTPSPRRLAWDAVRVVAAGPPAPSKVTTREGHTGTRAQRCKTRSQPWHASLPPQLR